MPSRFKFVSTAERPFTDDEVRGFHDLIHEPDQEFWDPGGDRLDVETLTAFFRDVVPSRPGQAVFLAKADDEVAGMAALFTEQQDLGPGDARLGFGVRASMQGQGIATRLLASALKHARASGLRRVVAEVLPHNLRAIHLLNTTGFAVVTPMRPAGEPMTHAMFEKRL